jgi:tetratricopeptide (TPR) repeat protein
MTYNQTLWRKEDVVQAREALARLAPSPAARAARARTPTEKGLLAAVDVLFGDGDAATRRQAYADAMGRLYDTDPQNPDVASFYALALMGTMSRGLIGNEEAHEGHVHGLAGSDVQSRVAAILTKVLAAYPQHPGALHYLLHDYDDPRNAHLGLNAARTLAKLAPASSHARHMPSHIFLQLGMWRDAAASDRAAFDASTEWVKKKNLSPALRNYHALAWLEYELLQRGRYAEAWSTIAELEPLVKSTRAQGDVTLLSDLASMRARFVVETRRWQLMSSEANFANVNDLFAIGAANARLKQPDRAEVVRKALAARAQSPQEGDLRPAIAIMEREVAALIEQAAGRVDQAITILREAAREELALPLPLGLPEPVKPANELLGEVLLEARKPREAIDAFGQALLRHPNRSLSVLGLARAAAAAGDMQTADRRFGELLENYADADADVRAAVAGEARRFASRRE